MDTNSSFRKNLFGLFLLLLLGWSCTTLAQQQVAQPDPTLNQQSDNASGIGAKSDIEFLIALSQTIIQDKARLQNLRSDSSRNEPIFRQTSQRFFRVTAQNDSLRNGTISPMKRVLIEHEWGYLKNTLDYLLQYRRSIHQQLRILQRKIDLEQEALSFSLEGQLATILEMAEQRILTDNIGKLPSDSSRLSDTNAAPVIDRQSPAELESTHYNWRIAEAERELARLKATFDIAQRSWLLVKQLTALNQDDAAIALASAQTSVSQLAQLKQTLRLLNEDRAQTDDSLLLIAIDNRLNETKGLLDQLNLTVIQDNEISKEAEVRLRRLEKLQPHLMETMTNLTQEIENKNSWLEYLQSPLAPHRIYSFWVHTGPRILVIILVLLLIRTLGRVLTRQLLRGLVRSKSPEERAERIETLNRTILNGLSIFVLLAGTLALLSEMGVEVSVLLGGAAVLSVAIGFGAQSLIKDYSVGFTILTENQYRVGNVVKINEITGTVEDINLRMTVLRDLRGGMHFIPHGNISTVSNLTHGWSGMEVDVHVAYKEDVDRVMEVIVDIARGMRKDPMFGEFITDEPEMLGVDALAESSVNIKMLVRTRPHRQWMVKRELLRRIKNRFDELGIEIPFPHYKLLFQQMGSSGNGDAPTEVLS